MITAIIVAGVLGLIGAAIGAGVSANNAETNYRSQKETNETNLKLNEENNKSNKELQELAYQQNIEQWERENEYNLPANQMKRFADAGLNPNLVYSQGNTSASSPSMAYSPMHAGQVVAPMRQNVDMSGMVSSLMAIPNLIKEMQLMPYQVEVAKNQAQQSTVATKFYQEQIETDLAFKRLTQDELVQKIASLKMGNANYAEKFRTEMKKVNAEIQSILKKNDLLASELTGRNLSNDALRLANKRSELELGNYQTEFDTKLHGMQLDNALKAMNLEMMPSVKGVQDVKGKVANGIYNFITNPWSTLFNLGKRNRQHRKDYNEYKEAYDKMNAPKKYYY